MPRRSTAPPAPAARQPLTRERVLRAAIDLSDRAGVPALTMRRLGAELGVEAMSLYKHIANKADVLDGMVELILGEIDIPGPDIAWKEAMRRRANSALQVLGRHSWAIGLIERRGSDVPAVLRYRDAIIGSLRSAGFSFELAAHAFWLLDNLLYGQVIQVAALGAEGAEPAQDTAVAEPGAEVVPASFAEAYPNLAAMVDHARHVEHSFGGEFEFGLELVLDALERARQRAAAGDADAPVSEPARSRS